MKKSKKCGKKIAIKFCGAIYNTYISCVNNSPPAGCYDHLNREELIVQLHQRDELVMTQKGLLDDYQRELAEAAAMMKELNRLLGIRNKKIFGSTSEKGIPGKTDSEPCSDYLPYEDVPKSDVQPLEPEQQQQAPKIVVAVQPPPKPPSPRAYKKPHPGRYRIPDHIPREERHIYPEGYESSWDKRELDPEKTERLSLRIQLVAEVTIRHKYARREGIIMAPFPLEDPFYKYKATCQLVAQMMWLRFTMHMPYYRFRQVIGESTVSYATLIGWCSRAFDILMALRPLLHQEILKDAKLLSMDETTFKLMDTPSHIDAFRAELKKREEEMLKKNGEVKVKGKGRNKETVDDQEEGDDDRDMELELKAGIKKGKIVMRGQMWVLLNMARGLVLFEYSPSRETINARLMLDGYAGPLMADAYTAYKGAAKKANGDIDLLNCWSHARRLFRDAYDRKNPDPVITELLLRIARLYEIETEIKGSSPPRKKRIRKRSIKQLLRMKKYLDAKVQQYAPKEPMAKAIQYVMNQWVFLFNYTRYGEAPIDNNAVERAIRPITVSRKNVLFLGSVEHAAGSSLLYSLMHSCRLQKIDSREWLMDVMAKIQTTPKEQLVDLLPHRWKLKQKGKAPPG